MAILEALLGPSRADGGWANYNPTDDYWYTQRGTKTAAGEDVTEHSALTLAAVFACVAKLSKTVATLPAGVFERVSDDERRPVVDHPLNRILQVEANPNSGAVTWREMMMAHLLLWGNWYAEEERTSEGELRGFLPLLTAYMNPKRSPGGNLYYEYQPPGGDKTDYDAADILHLVGLSLNGMTGCSVIGLHRETVGRGLAKAKFISSFFGNGTWMGGWLKQPTGGKEIGPDVQRRLLDQINERFRTAGKAFGVGFLAEGLEYQAMTGMPLKDAQYVEGAQLDRVDICGIFDVPPSKIHDDTRSTFSNIEHKNIDWMTDSILPWCIRIEAALKRRYFPDEPLYVKHNLAGLVRGDIKTRYEAYAIGRQWGWLSSNDIRKTEDMNPIDGGDNYLVPTNMAIMRDGEIVPLSAPQPAPQPLQQEVRLLLERDPSNEKPPSIDPASFAGLFLDAAQAVVAKEVKAIENAFKRKGKEDNFNSFREWLVEFYKEHETYFMDKFRAPLETALELLGVSGCSEKLRGLAAGYVAESQGWLLDTLKTPQHLPALLSAWRDGRAANLVQRILAVVKVLPLVERVET